MKKFLCVSAILLCFAMIGCGNKETNNNTVPDNTGKVSNTETEKTVNDANDLEKTTEEFIDGIDLYSDDTKYQFKITNNATAIFYHDGTNITGYETIITYGSAEEAEIAKSAYTTYEEDGVESLTLDGNKIVVKYKAEMYADMTLDEVKDTFNTIKSYQENGL